LKRTSDLYVPSVLAGFAVIATLACGIGTVAQTQQSAPIPVLEMLAAHTFGEYMPFDLSPDGKWVAYTLQDNRRMQTRSGRTYFLRTGASTFGNGCDIWVTSMDSGRSMPVTNGRGNNWSPAWSPDGRQLAFYSDRDGRARLWLWDATNDKLRRVSNRLVRSLRNPLEWTLQGKHVLLKVLPEAMTLEEADGLSNPDGQALENRKGAGVAVYRSSATDHGRDATQSGAWDLSYMFSDLVLVDVETAGVQVVASRERIAHYWLSPDGRQAAYAKVLCFESPASQQVLYDLVVYSFRTKESRIVASRVALAAEGSAVSWSPDSERIAFRTAGMNSREDYFVVAASGGTVRNLTSDLQANFSNVGSQPPLWDASGQHVFFVGADSVWKSSIASRTSQRVAAIPGQTIDLIPARSPGQLWAHDGGRSTSVITFDRETKRVGFFRIDLTTGEWVRLREENKSLASPLEYATAVSTDGQQVVYLAQDAQHSFDLWVSDTSFGDPRQLTHSNPHLEAYAMGQTHVISWSSLDGELLHGALLLPAGYQEGQRYALLVKVYGGSSQSNFVNRFGMQRDLAENLQLFATRGYAVLLPDAPLHVGTPMQDLMKTVLPGVNKVIEMGIADPDRLGLMGHSYGGYSTLCLLVQTPRFKAAMISGALGNLISGYGQMTRSGTSYGVAISETGQLRMGGPPWEHLERYVENSPALFLDRIKTPLLIVHGAADGEVDGVSPFLAEEIFVGLRRLGKSVEYAKYYEEDHWPGAWGHSNQLDFAGRVLAWFDKYLKAKASDR